MTTTSQPNAPGVIALNSPGVDILSPPPAANDIVDAGQQVSFQVNLVVTGLNATVGMYTNEPVEIKHHLEQIETGVRSTLGPFPFTTPATVAALNAGFAFTTGPFNSSLNGGGGPFETAPGDDDGTYRVLTEVHFTAARSNSVFDDRILVVTAP
jgi:hypothetical protein